MADKKTLAERIAEFEAKRAELIKQKDEIVNKAVVDEGRSFDEHENEQIAQLDGDLKAVDETLAVLKAHEKAAVGAARVISQTAGREGEGHDLRGGSIVSVKSNVPPGVRFTRFALAMAKAKGNVMQAHEIAKHAYKDTPEVVNALGAAVAIGSTRDLVEKAAVAIGTTSDAAWASPLVAYQEMSAEFIELLRPATILGRMAALRRVPFMMRAARQLTGTAGAFVGEGAPKPVGRQTYDNVNLGFAKAAVIVVMSDELVRFSNPQAEMLARDDMIAGIATYLDRRFIDASFAGVANVSPAAITNGVAPIVSSGTTLAAIDTDVASAMAMFTASDLDPATAVWVMSPATALRLSMKRTTQDEPAFPGLSMQGGSWYGLPVIVSSAMPVSGSPAARQIALVTQNEVFLADDGAVSIDMSQEASVQMDDAPTAGAQSLVSLWQNNLLGIRAERYINWAARRPGKLGIALITGVNY